MGALPPGNAVFSPCCGGESRERHPKEGVSALDLDPGPRECWEEGVEINFPAKGARHWTVQPCPCWELGKSEQLIWRIRTDAGTQGTKQKPSSMTWAHITIVWVWVHKGTGALMTLLLEQTLKKS